MTRLERKNRTDIKVAEQGGMQDLIDNAMKEFWRINDDELDYLSKKMSDEDLYLFVMDEKNYTIAKKRHILNIVNGLINEFLKLKS